MPQPHGKQIQDATIPGGKLENGAVDTLQLALDAVDETILDLAQTYDFDGGGGGVKVGTPVAANDAANKAYVDAQSQGLDPKDSVRVTTIQKVDDDGTTPVYANAGGASARGQITWTTGPTALDGVTLANGDRMLLKNEQDGGGLGGDANGIWVRTGADTWDRATDFDEDVEVTAGAFTFTEEGTINADNGFVLSTNNPIIIGGASGTSLVFTQFSGAGQIIAGAGLTKNGNQLDVGDVDKGVQVNADDLQIDASEIAGDGLQQVAGGGNEHLLELDLAAGGGLKIVGGEAAVEPDDFAGNGLEDDGSDNLRVKPDATETAPSIVVDANGVRAAVPTTGDKARAAQVTASDFDAAFASGGITITPAGDGYVDVRVNGIPIEVGDADKTKECFFSGDGGTTARALADIVATDTLHWVGSVANYELAGTDVIEIFYNFAA